MDGDRLHESYPKAQVNESAKIAKMLLVLASATTQHKDYYARVTGKRFSTHSSSTSHVECHCTPRRRSLERSTSAPQAPKRSLRCTRRTSQRISAPAADSHGLEEKQVQATPSGLSSISAVAAGREQRAGPGGADDYRCWTSYTPRPGPGPRTLP